MSNYNALIDSASAKYGVPANLLAAQIQAESSGNPLAVSPQGAQGLMQLIPATQKSLGVTNPYDPAQSIDAGARLDAENYRATKNWPDAMRMYHGGTDRANWGPKTQAYAEKVMANSTPSFDSWNQALGSGSSASGKTQQPAQSVSAPAASSFDDWNQALSEKQPAQPPGIMESIGRGVLQGVHDVIDYPAEKLAQGADAIGLTKLIGAPDATQTKAADNAYRNSFNQDYGNSLSANVGRVGGQILASAPVLASGGALIEGAGGAAGAALGADTLAGKAALNAGKFVVGKGGQGLTGPGGALLRGGSYVTGGALAGAGATALTAPAYNEPAADQIENGALYGAAGGALVPLIGMAMRPVVRVGKTLVAPMVDASERATTKAAANALTGQLAKDGITPEQAVNAMKLLGPDATLADVAGANLRNRAEVIANTPGAGSELAQVLQSRMENQPSRLAQAVRGVTGQAGDVHEAADALMAQRAAQAAPLYEKAFAAPLPANDERLMQFMANPTVQKGIKRGIEINQLDALAKGQPFNAADYAGVQTGQPTMNAMDAAKKGLDDLLEQYRDPTTGKVVLDQRGRAIDQVRQALVNHLDTLNPDYAAARQAWAGPSQALDAMSMGRRVLNNDPEVTAKAINGMSDSSKEFFLNGVTRALMDKIDGTPEGANAVRKFFGNDLQRQKLRAAFGGDSQALQNFEQQMMAEAQYAGTRNAVLSGSQTARRMAGMGAANEDLSPYLWEGMRGNLGYAATGAAKAIGNKLTAPSEKQMAAQASLMFSQDPEAVAAAFRAAKPGPVKRALQNALTSGASASKLGIPLGIEANQGR